METVNQKEMKITDWLITFLITAIPLVGLIMLFVWGFSENSNKVRSTWAKAMLVWYAIVIALSTLFIVLFGTAAILGAANY
jgi:hypothetical protein